MATEEKGVESEGQNQIPRAKSELVSYILGCIGNKFGFEPGKEHGCNAENYC